MLAGDASGEDEEVIGSGRHVCSWDVLFDFERERKRRGRVDLGASGVVVGVVAAVEGLDGFETALSVLLSVEVRREKASSFAVSLRVSGERSESASVQDLARVLCAARPDPRKGAGPGRAGGAKLPRSG